MKKYRCTICGYIYDESIEETKFEDLPDDWTCPLCGAPKNLFVEVKEETSNSKIEEEKENVDKDNDELREISNEEISYILSNLAKSCEKQYLIEEEKIFKSLSNYFMSQSIQETNKIEDLVNLIQKEKKLFENTMKIAEQYNDGGTKRVITWASKASAISKMILENYQTKGIDYIKNTKIWVCDICGFIYLGETPPEVCPICKVPNLKILEVI